MKMQQNCPHQKTTTTPEKPKSNNCTNTKQPSRINRLPLEMNAATTILPQQHLKSLVSVNSMLIEFLLWVEHNAVTVSMLTGSMLISRPASVWTTVVKQLLYCCLEPGSALS